jgi:hypothetical protein
MAPSTPAMAPLVPFAGGLAIAVGIGIAGYERLRLRSAASPEQPSEKVSGNGGE